MRMSKKPNTIESIYMDVRFVLLTHGYDWESTEAYLSIIDKEVITKYKIAIIESERLHRVRKLRRYRRMIEAEVEVVYGKITHHDPKLFGKYDDELEIIYRTELGV